MGTVLEIMKELRSEAGRDNPYPLYAQLHARGAACAIEPDPTERYQVVIHGYDAVDDEIVWDIIQNKLPLLHDHLEELIGEFDPQGPR